MFPDFASLGTSRLLELLEFKSWLSSVWVFRIGIMAKLVPKRKLRSQGPPSPIVKENAVPEDEGSIPEVILAADESDSDPEISTDGEESGEDDDGESMDDKEEDREELGSDDEEDGDSQGLVSIYIFCFI